MEIQQTNDNSYFAFNIEQLKTENQIGLSACGPTALKNVLLGLNIQDIPDNETLLQVVPARIRDYETQNLYKYLQSRALAGTTHLDLIEGMKKVNKEINGLFFRFDYRQDRFKFGQWIKYFMQNMNCIPVLTENLFLVGNDALHHQMVHGVDEKFIYLTNPEQKITLQKAYKWVSSESFMVIPKEHVLQRPLQSEDDIINLNQEPWDNYDVLQQIMQIYFEHKNQIQKQQQQQDKNNQQEIQNYDNQIRYNGLTIPWGGLVGVILFFHKKDEENIMNKIKELKYKVQEIQLPLYNIMTQVIDVDLYNNL